MKYRFCYFVVVVAPPLSVDSVTDSLKSLTHEWRRVGRKLFDIPGTVLDGLQSEYSSDAERLRASVRTWLLRDPTASWRKLIYELDGWRDSDFHSIADAIRSNAEKQSGQQHSFSPRKKPVG